MPKSDRPRFRVDADRQSGSRRVRYIETSRPDDGGCTLCQLDEENPLPPENRAMSEPHDDEAFAESTLIQAIENQLEAGEPAATQATLNKLTLVGYERDESLHMMALVLAQEIRQMLDEDRAFDTEAYETMLRNLPELPE
ncbi:MAG: hypothetical protein B7Z23_08690 [Pseudomonadales bacterium 32-61-5]|uniref:hypothetical protein n=1 Tax=Stutzerimonas stutzeri TaxID=316 RepID=UPI000BC6A634|nr:hypothetical protein [Stutzerimonas stutzeri]MBF6624151.1 hypothetical protein [Stutzerimonas stutzeri]MCQ4240981.1 hypothetical protein [Stutzerimonas stutzeri]OYW91117.1 MAG: hypothetical protein B7Z23_08690 [Pseudomonadales bacterium 32-61-5]